MGWEVHEPLCLERLASRVERSPAKAGASKATSQPCSSTALATLLCGLHTWWTSSNRASCVAQNVLSKALAQASTWPGN